VSGCQIIDQKTAGMLSRQHFNSENGCVRTQDTGFNLGWMAQPVHDPPDMREDKGVIADATAQYDETWIDDADGRRHNSADVLSMAAHMLGSCRVAFFRQCKEVRRVLWWISRLWRPSLAYTL
jgi:hypothetical protein